MTTSQKQAVIANLSQEQLQEIQTTEKRISQGQNQEIILLAYSK